jgi:hypothetical protein
MSDRGRRHALAIVALLVTLLCSAADTQAAVTHEYLPKVSEELANGVPPGCATGGPPCTAGPLSTPNAIAASQGRVWVADGARIDRFDASTGAFAGPQLDEQEGAGGLGGALAVGHAFSGEQVYVQAAGGVAVFDGASGKLLEVWSGAHTPLGSFGGERGVAVDDSESGLDSARGDVYVASTATENPEANVVDVFDPEKEASKAGEEPAKPVTVIEGTCETPGEVATGTEPCHESRLVHFLFPLRIAVSPVNGDVVVSDLNLSSGSSTLDVFEPGVAGEYRFLFAIAEVNHQSLGFSRGVAVDGGGDIYLGLESESVVDQFNAAGEYVGHLTATPSGPFGGVASVGVNPQTGHVFVGESGGPPVAAFGPSITIPDVAVTEPSEVHATHVTLNGTVKLDGGGSAECFFDYGTTGSYGQTVPCEPATVTEAQEHEGKPVPVKATIAGLQPDTTYLYRVRAVNGSGLPSEEDQGQATTSGPGLHGEFASEVTATATTLDATIDAHGSSTSYYFQYGETSTAACEATALSSSCPAIPAPPGEAIGFGPGDQALSQRAQGLTPDTTYHYRVVVVSEPNPGETEVFPEGDRTFTTGPAPGRFSLPDGRQWELVSPPDKHGALLAPIYEGWVIQSSLAGNAITYVGSTPTEAGAPGYFDHEQILSTRGEGGWSSRNISLPHTQPAPLSVGQGQEYRFFSEDLSLGLAEPFGDFTSLAPEVFPPDSERTPYLRHDLTCSSEPGTCYQPLVTGAPGYADVPEGTVFGGSQQRGAVHFVAATPDSRHVVMNSEAPLAAGAPAGALYEFSAGTPRSEELRLVSVLPEGGEPVVGEVGGRLLLGHTARGAVSADGSRVVWDSGSGLYLTDMGSGRSVRLDTVQPGASGGGEVAPELQTASGDDARVLFSDPQQLVKGAGTNDLYECEISAGASGPQCLLRDVAPGASVTGGVLGASADASYVYFVSGVDLYVVHYDAAARSSQAPVFIAELSPDDFPDWRYDVFAQTSRVSPNGGWLAFQSDRSLTGYDNHDARSGKPDEEVFLYDRAHARLICASCDPTGARPHGVEVGEGGRTSRLVSGPTEPAPVWEPSAWLAANIPAWTPFTQRTARYQSRYLSDHGRLFFNSSDALVAQDVNNQEDVYQYEPANSGPEAPPGDSCTPTSPAYSPASSGCTSLISSGTSHEESAFLDASENGDDVFFLTAEKLLPQDTDTALDVYDAHVCSAASPCAAAPASPSPCASADACRAAPVPQPEVFGAPASATFSGPGNPVGGRASKPKVKTAARLRAEELTKAVHACRRKHNRHKRAVCEAQARRRYGAKAKARRAGNHRRGT